jgi:hypothetical protein
MAVESKATQKTYLELQRPAQSMFSDVVYIVSVCAHEVMADRMLQRARMSKLHSPKDAMKYPDIVSDRLPKSFASN